MQDDKDGWKRPAEAASKESRQQRLKLALRENLKRRKSQIRGRSGAAAASETGEAGPDDAGEDGPDR